MKFTKLSLCLFFSIALLNVGCKKDNNSGSTNPTNNTNTTTPKNPNAPTVTIIANAYTGINAGSKVLLTMHGTGKNAAKIVEFSLKDRINGVTINILDSIVSPANDVIVPYFYYPYAPGTHSLLLTVTDANGLSDTAVQIITVVGNEPVPYLNISSNPYGNVFSFTSIVGKSASFFVTSSDYIPIRHMKVSYTSPNSSVVVKLFDSAISYPTGSSFNASYSTNSLTTKGVYNFAFTATNAFGAITTDSITQTVVGDFSEYPSLNLSPGGGSGAYDVLVFNCFVVEDYNSNAEQNGMLVCYYDNSSSSMYLASPDYSSLWKYISYYRSYNTTAIKQLSSSFNYAGINSASDIASAYNNSGNSFSFTIAVQHGTILAFLNSNGKYGILKVTNSPTISNGVTFSLKMQN